MIIKSYMLTRCHKMRFDPVKSLSQADNWFCFHLLSEGDAYVLGKYNSHYSDDILAHLIGEPIAGNCFMWSAPHQPFVLPVRVRDFESLYKSNVKTDTSTRPIKTPANDIQQKASARIDVLASKLQTALKEPGVKLETIHGHGLGIYKGQLYYLIKNVKGPSDYQTEDQLMMPLLEQILGKGKISIQHHNQRDYFCATKEDWDKARN